MKGSYVLLLHLKEGKNIKVGAFGRIDFPKGFYAYIGSAMNGIEGRVKRHLREDKKIHWHIDYLLKSAEVIGVYYKESNRKLECEIAQGFEKEFEVISKFGSSDCDCRGHLFYGCRRKLERWVHENRLKKSI